MRRPWHIRGCCCMGETKITAWWALDLMRWDQNYGHRIYVSKTMYGDTSREKIQLFGFSRMSNERAAKWYLLLTLQLMR